MVTMRKDTRPQAADLARMVPAVLPPTSDSVRKQLTSRARRCDFEAESAAACASHSSARRKSFLFGLALACVLAASVGGVVAWIATSTNQVENVFTVPTVTGAIPESFDGSVKEDVGYKNTGDIPVYVRANVVATWKDADGKVQPVAPALGVDYTISGTSGLWLLGGDGYWYYAEPLASGATTQNLIGSCAPVDGRAPEGCTLNVDVMTQALQASPAKAVCEAWGVTIAQDGSMSKGA